jgi:tetratricopeptide (TPR) repeat protein
MTEAIKIFYCYAHEDKAFRDDLEKHLSPLKRLGHIIEWYDKEILPGGEWKHEINVHLDTADVILLLMSPDFFYSDYCYSVEMKKALARHTAEDAYVVPILLRPVHWQKTPLGELQILPPQGKPITKWRNRDEAYFDIVKGIQKIVHPLFAWKCIEEGDICYDREQYMAALKAYDQAIHLEPDADSYYLEGKTLLRLRQFDEARIDFEQAIQHDPEFADAYYGKAIALTFLKQYQAALLCCEQAIQLNSTWDQYYYCKGDILYALGRFHEADETYRKAVEVEEQLHVDRCSRYDEFFLSW